MSFTIENLKVYRLGAKLKQYELAERIGCSSYLISLYERGKYNKPNKEIVKKLSALFEELGTKPLIEDLQQQRKNFIPPAPHVFEFIPGQKYIFTTPNEYFSRYNGFVFVYVKKINKIHLFREIHYGWHRGFSDLQIQDKIIKEVRP